MKIGDKIHTIQIVLEDEIFDRKQFVNHHNQIQDLFFQMASEFSSEYAIQSEHFAEFVFVFEKYYSVSFVHLFQIFKTQLGSLKQKQLYVRQPLPWTMEDNTKKHWVKPALEIWTNTIINNVPNIKMSSSFEINLESPKAIDFCGFLHFALDQCAKTPDCVVSNIEKILRDLCIYRNLCRYLKLEYLFYTTVRTIIHGLQNSEHFEESRVLGNEVLYCSYLDNLPELGYFNRFELFNRSRRGINALCNGIISLHILNDKKDIEKDLLLDFYIEAIRFCRNSKVPVNQMRFFYGDILSLGNYTFAQLNAITHAHYTGLLDINDDQLPENVSNFLELHSKDLKQIGETALIPWIVVLLRIKLEYPLVNTIDSRLEDFRNNVDEKKYLKYYNGLFGSLEDTANHLIQSLIQLSSTTEIENFVADNKFSMTLSHRVLKKSYEEKNITGYLLAMIIKSDFSIVFKNKAHSSRLKSDKAQFEANYYFPQQLADEISRWTNYSVLWLGCDGYSTFPVYWNGKQFIFFGEFHWPISKTDESVKKILPWLPLISDSGKFPEDYQIEDIQLMQELSYCQIPIHINQPILVVKDVLMSAFPHQLLIDGSGLVTKRVPITNVMSIEWLIKNQHQLESSSDYDPGIYIWIPIDSGDYPINIMNSRMEQTFREFQIEVDNGLLPRSPLNGQINIVVAHGNNSISTFPALYFGINDNMNVISNLDSVIGRGQILLLFVCHAGNEMEDFYRNQVNALAKKFLESGYQAVIAPFWSLNIEIPPLFLPHFLKSMEEGDSVDQAVYKGNQKVAEHFDTAKAYACLHLYGNPFTKITNR